MGPVRVIQGTAARSRQSAIEAAYDHFRVDRQGNLVSANTLDHYHYLVSPFFDWLREARPDVERFEDPDVNVVRDYRLALTRRTSERTGRPLEPATILDAHRLLVTFLRWADSEEYPVDQRILRLKAPKVPEKEPTLYHIAQLRKLLAACDPKLPQEELIVRILVGSGVRNSEVCGLAVQGPDGLSDLMLDSLTRGRVELHVRWDAGAKGRKSRRVPVTPRLASAIKRYQARHRRTTDVSTLLISERSSPYTRFGIDDMMDRLEARVRFRVHAHGFRHTFATVATKLGWNFEHLRAAMGHATYAMLQRYVRLASVRDLGSLKDWSEFIVANPALGFNG
jgi:integrase